MFGRSDLSGRGDLFGLGSPVPFRVFCLIRQSDALRRKGFVGASDCDDTDPGLWARSQPVGQVKLARAAGGFGSAVLSWDPILDPGGSSASLTYEVVRSRVASNFLDHPTDTCLDPGGTELQFTDAAVPPPGGIFFYLVRGRNACGPGSAGTRSNGTPRAVRDCAFSVVCNDANACTDDSATNGACTHTAVADNGRRTASSQALAARNMR